MPRVVTIVIVLFVLALIGSGVWYVVFPTAPAPAH
jgi:hypothetical protein